MEITKTQFKDQLDSLLDRLNNDNEEIVITDNGKPLFKVLKYHESVSTSELFAPLRGRVKYYEDLTTPTTEEWSDV
jgi:antitoxin (DNA-binding transcriptional repressor) of toxin-antitoxin stability system